jgi:hypothetical protein
MAMQKPMKATQRIAAILRECGAPLAEVVVDGLDVRELPRHVREKIVDELGEEFSARGLKPDREPHAYGLELEALTDAYSLAWDDLHDASGDRHTDDPPPLICIHKNGARQVTLLIQHVEGWRRSPAPPPTLSQPGRDADRKAPGLLPHGHPVGGRLRTVASQLMVPMVTS